MSKRSPSSERAMPSTRWLAIASGVFLALVVRFALASLGPGFPPIAAPLLGCASGGYLAGKLAKTGALAHGAYVGAGYIVLEAFELVPAAAGVGSNVVADTVTIIAIDAVLLAVASAGGWLASRS